MGILELPSTTCVRSDQLGKECLDFVDVAPIDSVRRRQDFEEGCLWRLPSAEWPAVDPFYSNLGCEIPVAETCGTMLEKEKIILSGPHAIYCG